MTSPPCVTDQVVTRTRCHFGRRLLNGFQRRKGGPPMTSESLASRIELTESLVVSHQAQYDTSSTRWCVKPGANDSPL